MPAWLLGGKYGLSDLIRCHSGPEVPQLLGLRALLYFLRLRIPQIVFIYVGYSYWYLLY